MSRLQDVILHDIFANRPAASIAGRLFYASDTFHRYRDNGTSWDLEDSSVSSGGGLLASHNLSDVSSAVTALANLAGAPNSAHFLTDRSEGLLTNEVNLGALASGLLFGTVSSSVAALSSKTLDLDGTLAANSDANVASQKAVKAYVDSQFSGGGGAPANAHFLTSQAESGLSAEVNLGALTTGLVFNTVSGGVAALSSKVIGTDVQTHSANLDTIAAITPVGAQFLESVSSVWSARTLAQVAADLQGTSSTTLAAGNDSRFTTITGNNQTASYTLVLADAGKVVEMNNASANTLTIPPVSSVVWPVGTVIEVWQQGAGVCTLTPGSGVTIRSDGGKLKTAGQYASCSLRMRANDEWVAAGDLSA